MVYCEHASYVLLQDKKEKRMKAAKENHSMTKYTVRKIIALMLGFLYYHGRNLYRTRRRVGEGLPEPGIASI